MSRLLAGAVLAIASAFASAGDDVADKTQAFMGVFTRICVGNVTNLKGLRALLDGANKLPESRARLLMGSEPGDAWLIPDRTGSLVLSLQKSEQVCTVYTQFVDAEEAEKSFVSIYSKAPAPLASTGLGTSRRELESGEIRRTAFKWSMPESKRDLIIVLTTSDAETAHIQGTASVWFTPAKGQ